MQTPHSQRRLDAAFLLTCDGHVENRTMPGSNVVGFFRP